MTIMVLKMVVIRLNVKDIWKGEIQLEKIYTLKKFVDLCNKCDYGEYISKGDKGAWQLANDIIALMKDENAVIEDEDNKNFYNHIREKNAVDKYVFSQDENIVAKVNVFEPFVNDKGVLKLNQKWHTLISFLAYLDYMNYAKYDKNSIDKIIVRKKDENEGVSSVSIEFADKKRRAYKSIGMCDWISHAIEESK